MHGLTQCPVHTHVKLSFSLQDYKLLKTKRAPNHIHCQAIFWKTLLSPSSVKGQESFHWRWKQNRLLNICLVTLMRFLLFDYFILFQINLWNVNELLCWVSFRIRPHGHHNFLSNLIYCLF